MGSMSCTDELADRLDAVCATPVADLAKYLRTGSRADEISRADLDRAGAGQHQVDRAPAVRPPTDTDNGQVRMCFVHVEDRSHSNRVNRRTAEAAAAGAQPGP